MTSPQTTPFDFKAACIYWRNVRNIVTPVCDIDLSAIDALDRMFTPKGQALPKWFWRDFRGRREST